MGLFDKGGIESYSPFRTRERPYKVTKYNPETKKYDVIAEKWTFAEAYSHPDGTHVMQTHGSAADLERQARGFSEPGGSDVARRVGGGFLLAGPLGAAVGALTGGGGRFSKWYELPTPIITPKSREGGGHIEPVPPGKTRESM